jgi:hypothetical protein
LNDNFDIAYEGTSGSMEILWLGRYVFSKPSIWCFDLFPGDRIEFWRLSPTCPDSHC